MADLSGIGNKQVPAWDASLSGAVGPDSVRGGTDGGEGVQGRQPLTISWSQRELDVADEIPDSALNRHDEFEEPFKKAYDVPVPSWLELQKSWGG